MTYEAILFSLCIMPLFVYVYKKGMREGIERTVDYLEKNDMLKGTKNG